MDYTAGCFPVTTVDLDLDQPAPPHEFYNHEDEALHAVCAYLLLCILPRHLLKLFLSIDKPELFKFAPVGLQVIARTQEEEAAIAMTELIDAALKKYKRRKN